MANNAIALQARTIDPVSALAQVDDLQAREMANDFTRKTQGDRLDLFKAATKSQLASAAASQENSALAVAQTRQMRLANAMALPQDAEEWDAAMQQAVDDGLPEAAQYIGRYNPQRQNNWTNALAASSPGSALAAASGLADTPTSSPLAGAPGSPGAASWDQRFAGMDPKQFAATKKKVTEMRAAIQAVDGAADPQAEWRRQAVNLGRPDMANDPDWRNKLATLKQTVIPAYNALGARELQTSLGIPDAPNVDIEHFGGNVVAVDKTNPRSPTAKAIYEGPAGGASGRSSVFQQKRQAWLDIHPDDAQGALDFASGKKPQGMSEADMRKSAMAQASRDLSAAAMAGATINDPQEFLVQAAQTHFAELQASNTTPGAGPKPAASAATPAAGSFTTAQKNFGKQYPENPKAKAGARDRPYYPKSEAQYKSLAPGAFYVDPTGTLRQKKS